MRAAKWVMLAILIAFLALAAYYGATLRSIHTYQVDYDVLPRDDAELQAWLNAQPGVRDVRVQRNERTLRVQFTMPWWYSATAVDVRGHAEANSYKGRGGSSDDHRPLWWK